MLRHFDGVAPSSNITDAIVHEVVEWCKARRVTSLYVCPYQARHYVSF